MVQLSYSFPFLNAAHPADGTRGGWGHVPVQGRVVEPTATLLQRRGQRRWAVGPSRHGLPVSASLCSQALQTAGLQSSPRDEFK